SRQGAQRPRCCDNPLNEGFLSLIYIDPHAPEGDNVKKLFDVRHISKVQETNPALPTYHLNAWKEVDESHTALPSDHPALDNPLAPVDVDKNGNGALVARPACGAKVAAHRAEHIQTRSTYMLALRDNAKPIAVRPTRQ